MLEKTSNICQNFISLRRAAQLTVAVVVFALVAVALGTLDSEKVYAQASNAQVDSRNQSTADPNATAEAAAAGPETLLQRGTGSFARAPEEPAASLLASETAQPRLDIVFDRAPVAIVAQTLLGDLAGVSVIIDPRAQGELTIRSLGQLTASDLPSFLRDAVMPLGLELVEQSRGTFLLRPTDPTTPGNVEVFRPGQRVVSGLVVYGLRYVAAAEMARLLQPFNRGVSIEAEPNREMLFLSGPPDQVQTLVETVEVLDVDWLDGMSLGIVTLQYNRPEAIIEQLRTLFGGAQGPVGSMIEFVPVAGSQSIIILAKRPERLDQARTWVAQLDRPVSTGGRIRFLPLNNANAEAVAETVSALFSSEDSQSPRITADVGRNALLVQSDPAVYEEIAALVSELDAAVDQVVIEVTIAEVRLNNDFRFGVQWSFDTRDGGRIVLSESNSGTPGSRFPGFSYGFTGDYVRAALNALASRTDVEVISSPVIVTLENKEAVLQVGDEVPIVTQSAANITTPDATVLNSVQYRETGILLRVTPRIGADGQVTLEVQQEASEVSPNTTSGIDSPTIQQRRFESTVTVADNETVALGGLIRANRTRTRSGVPILSAIPLVGAAFRNSTEVTRRTELIVFLTPRVIRSTGDAAAVRDDLRARLQRIQNSNFLERYAPAG